jgi:hypothetical protein
MNKSGLLVHRWWSEAGDEPSIDPDLRTCYIRGTLAAQERRYIRELFRFAITTGGDTPF